MRTPARLEMNALRRTLASPELGPFEEKLAGTNTGGDVAPSTVSAAPARAGTVGAGEDLPCFVPSFADAKASTQSSGLDRTRRNVSRSLPPAFATRKALRSVPEAERRKTDKATRQLLPMIRRSNSCASLRKCTVEHYPLLQDDTCWFLAVDFDQGSWAARRRGLCSWNRAGNRMFLPCWSVPAQGMEHTSGCSSVLLFRQVWPANSERALLTRAMERRHQLGLRSYDRVCFRIRTRCPAVVLAVSSLYRYRKRRAEQQQRRRGRTPRTALPDHDGAI